MAVSSISEDDFVVVEDLDLGDESELRRVIAEVESMVSGPGLGLRVSVLTSEQWKTVTQRLLKSRLRRGVEHHIHTLRDPREKQHLLISPSAVEGINEKSRFMYQQIVYAALRCIPTELGDVLRNGADDLLAEAASRKIGIEFFCNNYPQEKELVLDIAEILSRQFGHEPIDWVLELRRSPARVLLALCKSNWGRAWAGDISLEEIPGVLMHDSLRLDRSPGLDLMQSIQQYNRSKKDE